MRRSCGVRMRKHIAPCRSMYSTKRASRTDEKRSNHLRTLRIREGRERSLLKRHPWVFESAIFPERNMPQAGETVRLETSKGEFLAVGAYSPKSAIRVRVWSFDEIEKDIDFLDFFRQRIRIALEYRQRLQITKHTNSVRLIHGESDGIPGLVVDQYDDLLSVQFGAAGVEAHKQTITDALVSETNISQVYERSDAASRKLEGLEEVCGWLRQKKGKKTSAGGSNTIRQIREHDMKLTVDVATGHKTGYYLDQRKNRRIFQQLVKRYSFKKVLNCFSYTGGFSVAALLGGAAHVTSVDTSQPALEKVNEHVSLNGLDSSTSQVVCADANTFMRGELDKQRTFDAIVLDPPKFAPTSVHANRAARAYKDINRIAFKLLAPGGLLLTFSCSGGIDSSLFHKIVAGAAMDAGVNAYVLQRLEGDADHPTTMYFPEGEYLKGLALIKM